MRYRSLIFIALLFKLMITSTSSNADCETTIELHFRELFTGESVTISVNETSVSELTLKTKLQTGLAHIETVALCDGDFVSVSVPELETEISFRADLTLPFVKISLVDKELTYERVARSPGYM